MVLNLSCAIERELFKTCAQGPSTVAHTYNPSYSGGEDQEDHSSRPARAKS
jgi:hypothetical protein